MKMNVSLCAVLIFGTNMLFCQGCFGEKTDSKTEVAHDVAVRSVNSLVETWSSREQRKQFGPFPRWKIQDGQYRCSSLSMHYLINCTTHKRDTNKSLVTALYYDENLPGRYKFKFLVRKIGSEMNLWEEDESWCMALSLKGNQVQVLGSIESRIFDVKITVHDNAILQKYFQIKVTCQGFYDEFRVCIPQGCGTSERHLVGVDSP